MSSSVKIYDLEVFPNYFLAGFMDKDEESPIFFEIYDIDGLEPVNQAKELVEWIQDKWLVGYNSRFYDNQLIEYLCRLEEHILTGDADLLSANLFMLSSDIIQKGKSTYRWDLQFKAMDLMRIGNIDKSLKLCGVDLKMPSVQDLPRSFDEPVRAEELDDIRKYNVNDLDITKALYHELHDEIVMRKDLSVQYDLNLMDYADSGLADRLLNKFYSEYTNQSYWDFKDLRTNRSWIPLSDIISDKIMFKTKPLQQFLEKLKGMRVSPDTKFHERVLIGNTYYDILKGGIHSVRQSEIFEETDDILLKDADVSSYYPINMINNLIKPEHLQPEFLDVLKDVTRTRLRAKAIDSKSAKAKGLKITINSVFGKMGYKYSWMYDPKAMYAVTINGQLYLLMLIELLEDEGFEVFYANTDGITAKVPKDREAKYDYICKRWQEYTRFDLEFEYYKKAVIRDVNNYIIDVRDNDVKMKGVFDTKRWKDLRKGYECPVVPLAIKKYFIDGIPVEETIENHDDILDFCIAQKAGSKFDIYYYWNDHGNLRREKQQSTNRYYIGKDGGSLMKETSKKRISMVANQPVVLLNEFEEGKAIESYKIKYRYYIQEAYKIVNEFQSKQGSLF